MTSIIQKYENLSWKLFHQVHCHLAINNLTHKIETISRVGDDLWLWVTEFRCWWHLLNVCARRLCKEIHTWSGCCWLKWQKPSPTRIVVTNTIRRIVVSNNIRHQYPSPTSMLAAGRRSWLMNNELVRDPLNLCLKNFVIVTYLYWMYPNTLIVYNNTINSV